MDTGVYFLVYTNIFLYIQKYLYPGIRILAYTLYWVPGTDVSTLTNYGIYLYPGLCIPLSQYIYPGPHRVLFLYFTAILYI